jgi:flagellar biosynthesis/type III secretory pathway protein FliH
MAEESYRAKSARVESLSSALQRERQEFFARIEPELVRLAVTIAEKVIGRELELRPETVVDLVQAATKRLRERELLRVSVNPRDLERVREARDDLLSAVEGIQRLEIIEDRRVDPGGCVIESPNGTLDARIRTQLEEISRVLSELMPDPSLAEEDSPPEPHGTGPESLPASGQAD